jgi:hypothetical protein
MALKMRKTMPRGGEEMTRLKEGKARRNEKQELDQDLYPAEEGSYLNHVPTIQYKLTLVEPAYLFPRHGEARLTRIAWQGSGVSESGQIRERMQLIAQRSTDSPHGNMRNRSRRSAVDKTAWFGNRMLARCLDWAWERQPPVFQ